MKDTFIIRTEWREAIMELSPEEQGIMFTNLFAYHCGEEVNLSTPTLRIIWKMILPTLERNIEAYEKKSEVNRTNGAKGGRGNKANGYDNETTPTPTEPTKPTLYAENNALPDVIEETQIKRTLYEETQKNQTVILESEKSLYVYDSVYDNDNDTHESIEKKAQIKNLLTPSPRPKEKKEIEIYFKELGLNGKSEVEAAKFFDYYSSNGWKVGGKAMKDWQAAARNWRRRIEPVTNKDPVNVKFTPKQMDIL